jgi:hypothetical protein
VIHAYLGNNIVVNPELRSPGSLIKGMSGQGLSVTDFTHCITNAILCPRSNDVDHINEEACKNLNKQLKIYLNIGLHPTDCKDEERHFPVVPDVISNTSCLFHSVTCTPWSGRYLVMCRPYNRAYPFPQ